MVAVLEGCNLIIGETGSRTFVGERLVEGAGKSGTIDKLRTVGLGIEEMVVCHTDVLAVVLTALGGNQDGAIGTLIAIKRHGGSILEDGHMIDLVGTDDADVTFHTIDKDQWGAGAQALQSTNIECGILFKIGSRSLKGYQSVALAKNRVADVLGRALVHVSAGNDRDCCCGLGTGEILVGANFDDLVSEINAKAVLLCSSRQYHASEQ